MKHESVLLRLACVCAGMGIAGLLAGCGTTPAPAVPTEAADESVNSIPRQLILAGTEADLESFVVSWNGTNGKPTIFPISLPALEGEGAFSDQVFTVEEGPFADNKGIDAMSIADDLQYLNFQYKLYSYDPASYGNSMEQLVKDMYDFQQPEEGDETQVFDKIRVFVELNYFVTTPSLTPLDLDYYFAVYPYPDLPDIFQKVDQYDVNEIYTDTEFNLALREMPSISGGQQSISGGLQSISSGAGDVTSSPWGVFGSPFCGNPTGGMLAQEDFSSQWALGHPYGVNASKDDNGGDQIDIAIFDTYPGSESGCRSLGLSTDTDSDMCVSIDPPAQAPPEHWDNSTISPATNNHGLFVAGLVHTVAPASNIYLVKVLDDNGQSDVITLLRGLESYTMTHMVKAPNNSDTLDHTVINLSLGFAPNTDQEISVWGDSISPPRASQIVFWKDYYLGAVLVGASGNWSAGIDPLPPAYPAILEQVIGVGASAQDGSRSCYSNVGLIYAPGGDGGSGCEAQWEGCTTPYSNCPYGITSLVDQPDAGYALWAGSSFSTPLVSGLAALLLQAGVTQENVLECMVIGSIAGGAEEGAEIATQRAIARAAAGLREIVPIINVQATLKTIDKDHCTPPTLTPTPPTPTDEP